jgi:KaiC/GvpD/RAD55 family RecA-like ATPase
LEDVKFVIERIKTGVEGLDNLIEGGLPENTITLVSGPSGSGKTILCFHFLSKGLESGDKCLFLTMDRKTERLITQAKEVGFDFQSAVENGQIKFVFLDINKKFVYNVMTKEILLGRYNRVVLDSVTPLSEMPIYVEKTELVESTNLIPSDDFSSMVGSTTKRMHLYYIMNLLCIAKCTSMITSELPFGSSDLSRDGYSEFLVDGIILLNLDLTMDKRKLSVIKMRNTHHTLKPHDIKIEEDGIKFL